MTRSDDRTTKYSSRKSATRPWMMWKVPSSAISMPAKVIQPTQPDARGTASSPYFAAACASVYSEPMLMIVVPSGVLPAACVRACRAPGPSSLTHGG